MRSAGSTAQTYGGGAFGSGAVFRLAPTNAAHTAWSETILYSFRGGVDGAKPTGRLTFGSRGELYGTTSAGDPAVARYSN